MNNFQLLEVSAQNKGIELLCEVPDEATVFADSNTLNTVLRNLISNAIKFTGVDGKVSVRTRAHGSMLEIDISDTGVGMPPEVQERIFRLDKRISMKGTANETGTGLGLILSKEFVEKNRGSISVWSEEGKGTTFTLLLPTLPDIL
jgi:signal transduction histidine kinase